MIRLWGRDTSVNVQKVLWTLDEVGQAYERIDAGGAFGGLDTPEFVQMNPNRKIPVLKDGDFVLWESSAIVRYLAEAYGAGSLAPADVKGRAIANQWCGWCESMIYQDFIGKTFQPLVRVTAAERDNESVAAAAQRVGSALQVLDGAMGAKPFVTGNTLTYADIEIGAIMHRYFTVPIERPSLPNLTGWYRRLAERPSYQTNIMKDWTLMKIPGA